MTGWTRRGFALMGLAATCAAAWTWTNPTAPPVTRSLGVQSVADAARAERDQRARQMMVAQTFQALPASHQQRILEKLHAGAPAPLGQDALFRKVEGRITPETWDRLSPLHRKMIARIAEVTAERGPILALCFTPDTQEEVVEAFHAALQGTRFQQTARWGDTATDPGGLGQGDPTTLTYSFVPDGTFVPDLIGVTGNSTMFSFLNGIYGSPAVWQPIYDEIFAGWGDLCGVTYIRENNDDGVDLNGLPGVLGVRGDLRMAGIPIDGNSGVLAYNNFPEDGDMVIDTADNFYFDTSSSSLRLRNILYHEHGHGMGQLHVCPVAGTKLMEPFINLGFDGPQEDDILNAQRHYGDRFEHNDTPGTATPLGSLPDGTTEVLNVSCDSNTDVDFYAFTIPSSREVTVTMTPLGTTYIEGPQTSQCNTGSTFNALTVNDLGVQIIDTNGATIFDTADINGAGVPEVANANLPFPGTYFVRVFPGGTNNVQRYDLSIFLETTFNEATITVTSAIPSIVTPGTAITVTADILDGEESVTPGSETLHYRFDGGSFQTITMTPLGGDSFTATMPAVDCGDLAEYYVSAQASVSGTITAPSVGTFTTDVGALTTVLDDNFETDQGWTASTSGGPSSGDWERGVPVDDSGWAYDPASDSDGSGQCYLTENANGNTDVDGGEVILTSPSFDLDGLSGVEISYDYFLRLTNTDGSDRILVEMRDNIGGGGWVEVDRHDTDGGLLWRSNTITQADITGAGLSLSADMQIRFGTNDADPQSINESGLDAVLITGVDCVPVGCDDADGDGVCDQDDICPGGDDNIDTDGDGVPNFCDACPLDANDDSDGDGVCDSDDICPGGDDNIDTDGDGVPDFCDACPLDANDDSDGDGVCDSDDICPGGNDSDDTDGDGVPNFCDACPLDANDDSDGDGVCDSDDICPGGNDSDDTDGDGVPNFCDACPLDANDDSDGDGVCDSDDICPGGNDSDDTDGDGVPNFCDACPLDANDDSDGDGVCDSDDICPGGDDNVDSDGDGTPDFCDPCPQDSGDDSDGDGVCDSVDQCPGFDDNADSDGDGVADGCDVCTGDDATGDTDGDGVCDDIDPCPLDSGNDSDGDGVCDSVDQCPGFDDNADADGDGVADGCDVCTGDDATGDTDGDGVCDDIDPCPLDSGNDSDGDGVCDSVDVCPGGDDNVDTDGDGTPDFCDACPLDANDDSDGDGVCDSDDICPLGDDNIDSDMDGIPDACECPGDVDGDGDVDLSDLAALLAAFGTSGAGLPADLNGDGTVDLSDLAELLAEFGTTCD